MKKFYYIVGAAVTAAAVFTFIAVMLKKLRISLSIEGIDDGDLDENENGDIELSIDSDENKEESDYKEDEEYLKKELDDMLAEETEEPDIEVEIHEKKDGEEEK